MVLEVQRSVRERWPRADDSARMAELHGDMFEMSLAFGYLRNDDMPLVNMLSAPICRVRNIVSYVETHGPFDRTGNPNASSPLSSPKPQYVKRMASTLWNAMQVQYYRLSPGDASYRGYKRFARHVNLTYR